MIFLEKRLAHFFGQQIAPANETEKNNNNSKQPKTIQEYKTEIQRANERKDRETSKKIASRI